LGIARTKICICKSLCPQLTQHPEIAQRLAILQIPETFYEDLRAEAEAEKKVLSGQLSEWLIQKGAMKPEFSEILSNAFKS